MMVRCLLLLLLLLLPCSLSAAPLVEREELNDEQLLEIMVRDRDDPKDPYIGVATYYASRFIGRKTTSGKPYHPDKYTAAHAVLPLGTAVTVENIKTGQKVAVVINDRCRKRSFQLIDLSRIAAKEIGLWGKGGISVRIIPIHKYDPLQHLLEEKQELSAQ